MGQISVEKSGPLGSDLGGNQQKGATPDQTHEPTGAFPLLVAAGEGHTECVRLLLENGANPTRQHPEVGTARDVAVSFDHLDIIALLDQLA
ncbi:MAG: ankyrin repeat domain-containing protein [Gammaproteobacteria bacterium]|nr:ankyrin repeat domain-containing protein [Gammaproteobacteria bacterium]